MKDIDLKTILIGIFVLVYIFFNITDRIAKRHYYKMDKMGKHSDWKKKDKQNKVKIGRYVPFNDEYVMNTKTGKIFKHEIKSD